MKRIRFSLRSLMLLVFTAGAGFGLWWNWAPWGRAMRIHTRVGGAGTFAFSPDSKKFAAFCWNPEKNCAQLCVWSAETLKEIERRDTGLKVSSIRFSKDSMEVEYIPNYGSIVIDHNTSPPYAATQRYALSMDDQNVVHVSDPEFDADIAAFRVGEPRAQFWRGEFSPDGRHFIMTDSLSHQTLSVFRQRRPLEWWGVAWLPEFWLVALCGGGLLWSVVRDRKLLIRKPPLN